MPGEDMDMAVDMAAYKYNYFAQFRYFFYIVVNIYLQVMWIWWLMMDILLCFRILLFSLQAAQFFNAKIVIDSWAYNIDPPQAKSLLFCDFFVS